MLFLIFCKGTTTLGKVKNLFGLISDLAYQIAYNFISPGLTQPLWRMKPWMSRLMMAGATK